MRINLIINDTCQLNCDHCCVKGKCSSYLTPDEWKRVYNTLTELGDHIHLAGREPLINHEYMNHIHDPRFTFSVVTNGLTLKKNLPDLHLFNKIAISWDAYHNHHLPKKKIPAPLGVSTTLTSQNWDTVLDSIPEANTTYNIFDFYLAPVIPLTQRVIPDILSPNDFATVYYNLVNGLMTGAYRGSFTLDVKGPYLKIFKDIQPLTTYPHGSIYLERELGCRGGLHEVTICPDGEVLPCFFQFTPEYKTHSLGNILTDPIDEILIKGLKFRRENINNSHKCAEENGCECSQKCPLWVIPCITGCCTQ